MVRAYPGNPVEVVVVGGSFMCLRCQTVVVVTPEGTFESAVQPKSFIDAMRRAPAAVPGDDPFDMGMNSEPPMPGRRAR